MLKSELKKELRLSQTPLQQHSTCSRATEESLYGNYGNAYYEKLLPEIETVKAITFDGYRRRQLHSKQLLLRRKPMPCLDRTLSDTQFFSMAREIVEADGDLDLAYNQMFKCHDVKPADQLSLAAGSHLDNITFPLI